MSFSLSRIFKKKNARIRKPVFIVGCGRSGTSILFQVISRHQQLVPTNGFPDGEDHVGWIKHGGAVIAGLAHRRFFHIPIKGMHTGYNYCLHMNENNITTGTIENMHRYYHDKILKSSSNKRVLNKCPHCSNKLRYIRAIFPDAKFIHIIRDCLPVVSSWTKIMETVPDQVLYWPDVNFPCFWIFDVPKNTEANNILRNNKRIYPGGGIERLVDYWIETNKNIPVQLQDTPEQLLTIKYEDFCSNPLETLNMICQFCELEPFMSPIPEIHKDFNEKYKQNFTDKQIRDFNEKAHSIRIKFNYV